MSSDGRYSIYHHPSGLNNNNNNNYNSYPSYAAGPPPATGSSSHSHHHPSHPPPSQHQTVPPPLSTSSSYDHHPQSVVHAPPLRHARSSTSSSHSQSPHYPPPSSGGYTHPSSTYSNHPPPQSSNSSSTYSVHVSQHAQQSHPPQHWSPPPHQTYSTSPSSEASGNWGHYSSQSHQNSSSSSIPTHHTSTYGPPPSSSSSSLSAHEHPTHTSKMINLAPSSFSSSNSSYQGPHQRLPISGNYGLAPSSSTSSSRRQTMPMNLASTSDDRQKHGNQPPSAPLPTTAAPSQLQHNPQPPQYSSYSSSSQRYPTNPSYAVGPGQNYGSSQQQLSYQVPPSAPPTSTTTTPTVFQPTPLPPATLTPQPQYPSGLPDNVDLQYRQQFPPHHQPSHYRVSQPQRPQPHHPEPVSNTTQTVASKRRRASGKESPAHLSSVGSSGGPVAGSISSLMSTTPVSVSSPQSTSHPVSTSASAPQHYHSHQQQQQPQYHHSPTSQVSVIPQQQQQPPPHYPSSSRQHHHPPPLLHQPTHQQSHHQSHQHPPPPTTHPPSSSSSLSGYNGEAASGLIGPGSSSSMPSHQTAITGPPLPAAKTAGDSPSTPGSMSTNGLDFMKLVESYRVILDTAGSISDHGRSAPGQGVEMEISPETMNVMQKNAEYGREVLDAALKIVRGESPAVDPGSIPPPMSVPTTTTRLVGHGVSSSVSASTTTISSSSLAGAVTSPQEAAASSAPTSSLPKTIVAVKVDKDVGGIRVIEDGPLKKMESKEGGTKSSDRKRQKTTDDGQHDGQTCLGCRATSTPEWRRGPLGPRTLCNACGLVYAKMIKKRCNNKSQGAKKTSPGKNNGGSSTQVLGGTMGGQMHVIGQEESADENSGAESYSTSQERCSEMAD